ncbi:MAG: hypothetical protein KKC11_04950 [Candidatus Omnitrophica bacterium]|nr:hypothetical protein [Candidatus Omnitrophota bacterium]MBU1133854.1 hypothetical protein [Candidatus Omnitrophota bacterium]
MFGMGGIDIKTEEYVARLTFDCRKRHKHTHFKNKIVRFTTQLEVCYENNWYPIIRYDTSHGFAHRDFIHPSGRIDKTPLFLQDYNEALIFAENDLKNNWELYREKFLKEVKND